MSIPNKTSVCCPRCGASFTTTVWSSVNTDLSEDLPERIISGEFFDVKCPKCGFAAHFEYDLLYHDMKHSAMIWVVHEQDSEYASRIDEIKHAPFPPGYQIMVVHDMNALREKVAVLESGKDDRIIELCKVFVKREVLRQNPKFIPRNAFYTFADGEGIVFVYSVDGKELHCVLEDELYDTMKTAFAKALMTEKANSYVVYDEVWAETFFSAHSESIAIDRSSSSLDNKSAEDELSKLSASIQECETKLEEIKRLGLENDTIKKKAADAGVSAKQYKKDLRREYIDFQRKYNAIIEKNGWTDAKEKHIIDTYDDCRYDENHNNGYKLLDKVEIDIEKRLKGDSTFHPWYKIDENNDYIIYNHLFDFIRKDKKTGEFVFFGSGSHIAAIYSDWVYFHWVHSYDWAGGITYYGTYDKYIIRRKLDASAEERLDWLSNKKTGKLNARLHMFDFASEDEVQKMYVENGSLIIVVKRISEGGGTYKIIVTESGDSLSIEKEIVEGEMRGLITPNKPTDHLTDASDEQSLETDEIIPDTIAYMAFKKNPFYVLNVTCFDNRRTIMSASDEMSFLHDADLCSNAAAILTTPSKRLSAEIGWFIGISEDLQQEIKVYIESKQLIPTDGLTSLSKLNACLYNFSLSRDDDYFETGYSILDIDEQYAAIDIASLTDAINQCRSRAKMPDAAIRDVSEELGNKRASIRLIINEKLSSLDEESYVELVTMLAEKCIADESCDEGVVLTDVVDQYEIRMQTRIEDRTAAIKAHIGRIKRLAHEEAISSNMKPLIRRVTEWDKLVQPLQLRSMASGMPHENSIEVGYEIRALALYLHNEKGKTDDALALVNAMKEIFTELDDLFDFFNSDSETLEGLAANAKETKEILTELEAVERDGEELKVVATSTAVNSFISRVEKLNGRILKLELDEELSTRIREKICQIARETAVELHNRKQHTEYALSILRALQSQFSDVPSLKARLTKDVSTLNQQLIYQNAAQTRRVQQESTSKTKNIGCLVVIGILFLITIIYALTSGGGTDSGSNKSSSAYSASQTATPETKFSSSSTSGAKVYADIVSIWPAIGIYSEGSSNYSYFVCECKTSSGSTVWVYMTVTEYRNNFDSSASTSVYSSYADEVTYTSSKRIHGIAKKADNIMSGLSSDTGTMVIDFSSLD